jgi:hypothetical protein
MTLLLFVVFNYSSIINMILQLFVNYAITKNKIKTVVKNCGGRMSLGCSQKLQKTVGDACPHGALKHRKKTVIHLHHHHHLQHQHHHHHHHHRHHHHISSN